MDYISIKIHIGSEMKWESAFQGHSTAWPAPKSCKGSWRSLLNLQGRVVLTFPPHTTHQAQPRGGEAHTSESFLNLTASDWQVHMPM